MLELKVCTNCGEVNSVECFGVDKRHKDGRQSHCRKCQNKQSHSRYNTDLQYNKEVKERAMLWYADNKEKAKESARLWALNNKGKRKIIVKKYDQNNKDKKKSYNDIWRKINPDKVKEKNKRSYVKQQSAPSGKLNNSMSSGIYVSLKKGAKAGRHWEALVGYTVDQLKKHLEKQFKAGMTWDNYGQWHIDHIIPLSAHNFNSPEDMDFKRAWALKNLQPMWAIENIKKRDKLMEPFQPSLAIMEVVNG